MYFNNIAWILMTSIQTLPLYFHFLGICLGFKSSRKTRKPKSNINKAYPIFNFIASAASPNGKQGTTTLPTLGDTSGNATPAPTKPRPREHHASLVLVVIARFASRWEIVEGNRLARSHIQINLRSMRIVKRKTLRVLRLTNIDNGTSLVDPRKSIY